MEFLFSFLLLCKYKLFPVWLVMILQLNKTKDLALVQNAALACVEVKMPIKLFCATPPKLDSHKFCIQNILLFVH